MEANDIRFKVWTEGQNRTSRIFRFWKTSYAEQKKRHDHQQGTDKNKCSCELVCCVGGIRRNFAFIFETCADFECNSENTFFDTPYSIKKRVPLYTKTTTLLRCRGLRPVQCLVSPRLRSGLFSLRKYLLVKRLFKVTKNARFREISGVFVYISCTMCVNPWYSRGIVELVGFEPTSKQGNHTLSTCLFQPSVFVPRQDLDHQSRPYPLKFHPDGEAHHRLFPIYLHRLTLRFGTTSLERCLVPPTLWRNKANLLYFD